MLMSHYQKVGQKLIIKIANSSFENVTKFKYLGTTLTDQNCMHMGEERKVYKVLVRKPKRKRLLKRQGHRREDEIKMDLTEIGWVGVEWIDLAQDRDHWQGLVNMVMKLWVLAPWS
jgi:hypothetical protein